GRDDPEEQHHVHEPPAADLGEALEVDRPEAEPGHVVQEHAGHLGQERHPVLHHGEQVGPPERQQEAGAAQRAHPPFTTRRRRPCRYSAHVTAPSAAIQMNCTASSPAAPGPAGRTNRCAGAYVVLANGSRPAAPRSHPGKKSSGTRTPPATSSSLL